MEANFVVDQSLSKLSPYNLYQFLYEIRDNIAIYEPIHDAYGTIVDGRLLWANHSYKTNRRDKASPGQLISELYVQPEAGVSHLSVAWDCGYSIQTYVIEDGWQGKYRNLENLNGHAFQVRWQRVGSAVMTVSPDLTEQHRMQAILDNQKSLLAIAARKRAMAVERERIARNLHDTVIQNLYATSLSLSIAGRKAKHDVSRAIDVAIDSLADVISEIRREILDIEMRRASPLRLHLEDALIPILNPSDTQLNLRIDSPDLNDEFSAHVRAVCVEAASNAVRHGGASVVAISVVLADEKLSILISDDGSGFPSDVKTQNGLHNMRERAESLGGNMEITSEKNQGTTIKWSIPCSGWCA
jgi:signal transduction histidine kinase